MCAITRSVHFSYYLLLNLAQVIDLLKLVCRRMMAKEVCSLCDDCQPHYVPCGLISPMFSSEDLTSELREVRRWESLVWPGAWPRGHEGCLYTGLRELRARCEMPPASERGQGRPHLAASQPLAAAVYKLGPGPWRHWWLVTMWGHPGVSTHEDLVSSGIMMGQWWRTLDIKKCTLITKQLPSHKGFWILIRQV